MMLPVGPPALAGEDVHAVVGVVRRSCWPRSRLSETPLPKTKMPEPPLPLMSLP